MISLLSSAVNVMRNILFIYFLVEKGHSIRVATPLRIFTVGVLAEL